ncbi:MAG: hypothetical protein HS106_16190 [Ideonella sp.]|nr:hypothetical protein [Ideonella sp.]
MKHKPMATPWRLIAGAAVLSIGTGCMPSMPPMPATQAAPAPAAPTAGAPAVQASTMSYGTVTSQVVKGKTTQLDLLQLFGGPSIATTDRDGVETWVYERTATQTDVQSHSQAAQGALNLGLFFKHVDLGASGSMGRSATAASTSSSVRSLTVIVKFAADKTVADYSVRASTF